MINRTCRLKVLCLLFLLLATVVSCKKDSLIREESEEIISPTTGTRLQFSLDSVFLYARQVYLWNNLLPNYAAFNPREKYKDYAPDLSALEREVFDISQIAINPLTAVLYEQPVYEGRAKYSYLVSGKTTTASLAATLSSTGSNPVLLSAVFNVGDAPVGYIVLSSFPKLTAAQSYLEAAFAQMAMAGVTELIVDLRSNGGGYVETAEYVANLIATSNLNGKTMYTEQYNSQMQQGKALILRHQPYLDDANNPVTYNGRAATMADVDFTESGNTYKFSKKGNLESVKNLYFIVSANTASASELLINCLQPYFNVKLAGAKTYGKPVGFFGVLIDTYTVYLSGFLIKNSLGTADYFDGIGVDIPVEPDGKYTLGDPDEACLSKVLSYIQTVNTSPTTAINTSGNTVSRGAGTLASASTQLLSSVRSTRQPLVAATVTAAGSAPLPNSMIEHRHRLKNLSN